MQASTTPLVRRGDGTVSTAEPEGDGPTSFVQLAATNFVPAKMTLEIAYPRPDSDGVHAGARHKWLIPSKGYRIPIIVKGGAYPFGFRFGANHTLPNSNIGEFLEASGDVYTLTDDYGVLNGVAPASGTYVVHIEVIDQDGGTAVVKDDIQWTITVDASHFIYFDSNAVESAETGTEADPYTTPVQCWGTDTTTPFNADKIIVVREGTHVMTGMGVTNNNIFCVRETKPIAIIKHPEDTGEAVLDLASGVGGEGVRLKFDKNSGNNERTDDMFFGGVVFDGSTSKVTYGSNQNGGYQAIFFSNGMQRTTFFDVNFRNWRTYTGHSANENPAVMLVQASASSPTNWLCMSRVTFDGTTNGNCTFFDLEDSVFEYIDFNDVDIGYTNASSGAAVLYFKGGDATLGCARNTVRMSAFCNNLTNSTTTGVLNNGVCVHEESPHTDIEVSYCKFYTSSFAAKTGAQAMTDIWYYRNSSNGSFDLTNNPKLGITVEKNAFDDGVVAGVTDTGDNLTDANCLDATLDLESAYRIEANLGRKGAEVAA